MKVFRLRSVCKSRPEHWGNVVDAAEQIVDIVEKIPGTRDVQIAQSLDYPQFDVQVDRTRAKFLGVDQKQVCRNSPHRLGFECRVFAHHLD